MNKESLPSAVDDCADVTSKYEKKMLQVVNLSPDESVIEKLTEMHPMRQVVWASIIQISVLGFMGVCMFLISKVAI